MGLDQYAFVVKPHAESTDFIIGWENGEYDEQQQQENMLAFCTWRKHPNLQGWMEKTFNRKADIEGYVGRVEPAGLSADGIQLTGMAINPKTGEEIPFDEVADQIVQGMQEEFDKNIPSILEKILENASNQRVFNCQPVRLNLSDLEQLETAVNRGELPATSGFFFGDNADEEYKEQDLQFIKMSREAINHGYQVYYNSWW
jgi:hypothetical protein